MYQIFCPRTSAGVMLPLPPRKILAMHLNITVAISSIITAHHPVTSLQQHLYINNLNVYIYTQIPGI